MTFEDWFDEIENFSVRSERLYEDFREVKDMKKLVTWLEAAYNVGYDAGYENQDGFGNVDDDDFEVWSD